MWMFPIIFMIHEFEEIIFTRWWVNKNRESLPRKYPKLGRIIIEQLGGSSTEASSLIIAEEFLVLSMIVVISALTMNYNLFVGLVTAYSVHLVSHIGQSIFIRQYTPAVVTAILTGIYGVYVIYFFIERRLLELKKTVVFSVLLTLFVFLNLIIMHKLTKKIKIWHQ